MDLQVNGKVIEILKEQSGESQNGPWRKQDFILETTDQYPKKICITQWGDKIDQFGIQKGETITAFIDLQSREYNGRWYTDVKAWKIEKGTGSASAQNNQATPEVGQDPFDVANSDDTDDGLPF